MPDYAGSRKIGFLLAGGAGQIKREAFDEGRLNTAKTEDALANARLTQLKATAAAEAQRAQEHFETDYIATNSGKGRPPIEVANEARMLGNLLISGHGADYYSSQQGQSERQEQDFRRTLGDTGATPDAQLAAGSAIQGKEMPNIVPVGTHGVEDLLHPEKGLITTPGSGTTAMRNYAFNKTLPPEEQNDFSPFVRADQVVNAGGVPTARRATTGTAAPVVDAATVADNAADIAEGKKTGTLRATQKADFPMVRYTLDQNKLSLKSQNELATDLYNDDKLWQAVGPTQLISKIPGVEGAHVRAQIALLTNKLMLSTLINLRAMSKTGGAVGNVSDKEGDTMKSAIAALSDPNLSAGAFRKELGRLLAYNAELETNLDRAFNGTYDAQGNPLLSTAPRGTSSPDGSPAGEDGQPSIADEIVNRGDGEYDDEGNLVRADGSGWTFETDAAGNAAWVSPDRTQYEEVAQ